MQRRCCWLHAAAHGAGLSELDADGDGKVSSQEAVKSRELMVAFDRADANGDGYLDRAEFQRAREVIREQDRRQHGGHQPRRH